MFKHDTPMTEMEQPPSKVMKLDGAASEIPSESKLDGAASEIPSESKLDGAASEIPSESKLDGVASEIPSESKLDGAASEIPSESKLDGVASEIPSESKLDGAASEIPSESKLDGVASEIPSEPKLDGAASQIPSESKLDGVASEIPSESKLDGAASEIPSDNSCMEIASTSDIDNITDTQEQEHPVEMEHKDDAQIITERALFNPQIGLKILENFELKEVNNFSRVCTQWLAIAHEHFEPIVFNCEEMLKSLKLQEVLEQIKERPLLKNIIMKIFAKLLHDTLLDCILQHVEDVHVLEMAFPTLAQINQIVEKYPNLKCVSLDHRAEDLVSSLTALRACKKLVTLKVVLMRAVIVTSVYIRPVLPSFCEIIAEGFPKLKELHLNIIASDCNGLRDLLRNRSEKLEKLEISFSEAMSEDALDSLNSCTNLKHLKLVLHSLKTPVTLTDLKSLKVLKLTFCGNYTSEAVSGTVNSVFVRNVEIMKVELQGTELDLELLTKLSTNATALKHLNLSGVDKNSIKQQLSTANGIPTLEHLLIDSCNKLDNYHLKYFRRYPNLQTLCLMELPDNVTALENLNVCANLKSLSLCGGKFSVQVVLNLILKLSNLMHFSLLNGCVSSDYDKQMIKEQCDLYGRKIDFHF